MTDILITAIVPLALLLAVLWRNRPDADGSFFFSKDYTSTLKGICAIVVIFVHVPPYMQNPLQDAIGSFAFVAVTVFFMFSAYGMLYSAERKKGYLTHYWRNRLLSLLIPNIIVNIAVYAAKSAAIGPQALSLLYTVNHYVVNLLEYCLLFYIVAWLRQRYASFTARAADAVLISAVTLSSLALYFMKEGDQVSAELGWCYERMGLVWGILAYRYGARIKAWMGRAHIAKTAVALLAGLVLGVAYLKFKHEWFTGEYLLKIALGFALIAALSLLMYGRRYDNAVTRWLGSISFEVYLAHGSVMAVTLALFPQLGSGVFMVVTVGCTILIGYLTHIISSAIVTRLRK